MAIRTNVFTEHEVELGGGRLRYQTAGEGRPILCLHGAGGMRITPAHEILADSFRLFVPTMPGFDGQPPFPNVNSMQELAGVADEFVDKVIRERVDVIGHSFGGWLATWFTVLYPERVGQLILEASAGFRPEGMGGIHGVSREELRRRGYVHPERLIDEKPADVQAQNHALVERYHGPVATDKELVGRLDDIHCLTLLVQGTEDGLIPAESGRLLKKHIPSSYLTYIYDAAHGIEIDQPERFAALVHEFLERGEAFIINWKD